MSNSPFTPGYGMQPLVFGGHEGELIELRHAFQNYDFGDRKSILLSGLRGAGKTSMLAQLRTMASDAGWTVIADNASSGMLTRITDSLLPEAINKLQNAVQRDLVSLASGSSKRASRSGTRVCPSSASSDRTSST